MDTGPPDIGYYMFGEHIGRGEFSDVYKVINKQNNNVYACKIISKSISDQQRMKTSIDREIKIMKTVDSLYIVKFVDYFEDENSYYLIMEYCQRGTLLNMLVKGHGTTNDVAKRLFYQILLGLSALHSAKIAHLDIKPENIYLDENENVKIGDFSISGFFEDETTNSTSGTKYYVSPECISGIDYNPFISDMWSLGVTLYCMVTGNLPWKKGEKQDIFRQIQACDYTIPLTVIPEIKDVIQGLLQVNPEERWNIEDCLNSRWLYKMSEDKFYTKLSNSDISLLNTHELEKIEATTMITSRSSSQSDFKHESRISPNFRKYLPLPSKNSSIGLKNITRSNTKNPAKLVVPRMNHDQKPRAIPSSLFRKSQL